jgi:uncharacterized membrane protein YdbT with pleckstrin-like domain
MSSYVHKHLIANEHVVYETELHWITYFSIGALLSLMLAPFIARATSEFAVTNKRIVIKTGLFSRRTIEMNMSKVESVVVDQSILGRILGYGTIIVVGSGGTKELFHCIADPLTFRRKFQEVVSP